MDGRKVREGWQLASENINFRGFGCICAANPFPHFCEQSTLYNNPIIPPEQKYQNRNRWKFLASWLKLHPYLRVNFKKDPEYCHRSVLSLHFFPLPSRPSPHLLFCVDPTLGKCWVGVGCPSGLVAIFCVIDGLQPEIQTSIQLLKKMNNTCMIEQDFCYIHLKERYSATTCSSNSLEEPLDHELSFEVELIPMRGDLRCELFENGEEICEVTQKMSQRAVSWIMTVCWSKNIDGECLWSTLLLYYCLKSQRKLKKEQLQPTLLACLSLSLKMTHPNKLSLKQIISLSSKPIPLASILSIQAQILQQVDFNLIIPHYLTQIYSIPLLTPQQIDKLEFLCEMMMVKNEDIFFNREKIEGMVRMVTVGQIGQEFKEEVRMLWGLKECKIVVNKYASRFDVQHLVKTFL